MKRQMIYIVAGALALIGAFVLFNRTRAAFQNLPRTTP